MYQAIVDVFSRLGGRPVAIITRYIGYYTISAIEHAIKDHRGYIGIAPGDLRRIIRNCIEDRATETENKVTSIVITVAGFPHSFSDEPSKIFITNIIDTFYHKYGVAHREREPYSVFKDLRISRVEMRWAMYGEYYRENNMPQKVLRLGHMCCAAWVQTVGDGYAACGAGSDFYIQLYPRTLCLPGKAKSTIAQHTYREDGCQITIIQSKRPYELRDYLYPTA